MCAHHRDELSILADTRQAVGAYKHDQATSTHPANTPRDNIFPFSSQRQFLTHPTELYATDNSIALMIVTLQPSAHPK